MMTAEQRDAFSEIVNGARAEFSQAYQNSDQPLSADVCAGQIENLAFAAEMAELDGLTLVCQELGRCVTDLNDREQLLHLVQWTDHMLAFIRSPSDPVLAEQLVNCLPETARERCLHLLQQPASNSAHMASDELIVLDTPQPETEAATVEEFTAPLSLQQLLITELDGMARELGKVLDEMFGATFDAALEELKARYADNVQRLADTAQLTELLGLEQLCRHILANTERLTRTWLQSHRSESYLVFRQWPALVLTYLREPDNDEHCLALINHMELAGWPQPIDEATARTLLERLLATGTVQAQVESTAPRSADPADLALTLPADLNPDLFDAFLHDAPSQAAELAACASALTGAPSDSALILQAQRITHTLKGAANIVGIRAVANLAHALEDLFERLRIPPYHLDAELHLLLQASADCMGALIGHLQGQEEAPDDRFLIYQQLVDVLNATPDAVTPSGTAPAGVAAAVQQDAEPEWNPDADDTVVGTASVETVRVPLQVISSLFQLAEEITIALGSSQEQTQRILKQLNDVNAQDRRIQEQRFELETAVDVRAAAQRQRRVHQAQDAEFDSLELDQYDEVYDLTHGLIEAVADARELNRDLGEQLRQLESLQLQQSRLNKELQRLVKHTRLVPAQALVPRLQRCIRHAARITGKLVQFDVRGIDTEINEDVLNKLADPLMHLLRNAVDHGIEAAQERTAKSKSPQGYIELSFAQDGQHILIRCDDDGGGIDHGRVKAKAVQRGLIDASDVLTDAQIVQLLLTPGFSTKDSINQVSGRGIGMDAVYKRVRELGGQLQILPRQSGGTRCELKVPLQLVASHALLVQVQQQCFAIPTRQLNQILPPGGNVLTAVGEQPALAFDNQIYPAYSLGRLLGVGADTDTPSQWPQRPVLLTQSAQEAAAIAVDAVLCNQELVIKTTGDYVKNVPGVAGVAILGDGRLVPVLDLPALLERRQPLLARNTAAESGTDDYYANDARVLIVDDSLSVRKSLAQLVGDAGYRIDTARDGLDAWEKIRQQPPALVLTDLEMPRLNGIELADRIRNDAATQHIPVLMITSRSLPKHRGAAEKAGVTDYFTKPFAEGELLGRIHQFLAQRQGSALS